MSEITCELSVRFAAMPRARLAAYRNAMDILAEYLLKLEADEEIERDGAENSLQQPALAG